MSKGHREDVVCTREEGDSNRLDPLIVLESLTAFLDEAQLGDGKLEVEPIGDGVSNVTYLLARGPLEMVLRRPPRGPLPPSVHDVIREARLLQALEGVARVPRVLSICEDEAVVGAPFFVMERVLGFVITRDLPSGLDDAGERRRLGEELIDALVGIHALDWDALGLADFGHGAGYLERQLRRFQGLWAINKTREVPAVDRVAEWLVRELPSSGAPTLVHGDFRLGNVIVDPYPPARIVSILDWEMATIGDPLADLGYMCAMWPEAGDPPGVSKLNQTTRLPGFPTRAEVIERYAERAGRSVGQMEWYQALALWKAAVFMEGNYRRALDLAGEEGLESELGQIVIDLGHRAEKLTSGSTR